MEKEGQQPQPTVSPMDKPLLVGVGGTSYVYQITSQIAVKLLRSDNDAEEWDSELRICGVIVAARPPSPFIMQSYLRLPEAHFVEMIPPPPDVDAWLSNRDLQRRLQQHQQRARRDEGSRVLAITGYEKLTDVNRWIAQVCAAAAWLESVPRLAHGDIQPTNVVLDANGDARLVDFSRTEPVGSSDLCGSEPFARHVRRGELEEGVGAYGYGLMGPRTETFSLGSFIYCLVYGHSPYETEYWGKETRAVLEGLLQNMQFPYLTGSAWDDIIEDCWFGRFASVTTLRDEVLRKTSTDLESVAPSVNGLLDREQATKECQRLVEERVLDSIELPKFP